MQADLDRFFDAYGKSFANGPAAVAAFYCEPSMTARMGHVRLSASNADTTTFFAGVDEQYRGRGYTHADYIVLDLRAIGTGSALATLRWAYKNAAEETLWETTFSYNLLKREGAWKILLQTMHEA